MKIEKKNTKKETKTFEEKTMNGVTMRVYPSGFASLAFEVAGGTVIINGFVRESKNGDYFFSFPSVRGNDNEYHNQAYVIGEDLKVGIQTLVDSLTAD